MHIQNPKELVGKQVFDTNGTAIGTIDKTWQSWNHEYPGWFFGIRPNENTRCTYFRGTNKYIPIYSDYIREWTDNVYLTKTVDDLARFWNKTVMCGTTSWPTDYLVEKPVYDKNHCRVGTFCGWVEGDGTFRHYGLFVDPYLCETWNFPFNKVMPIPTDYITNVTDTICLNKTMDEIKTYWQQYLGQTTF